MDQIVGQGENPQGSENTGNPAWQEFLAFVPESEQPKAQEVLQKWDQGVQNRFTARAEELKPYQPFIDQKIAPEVIQGGIDLYKAFQERPQDVFKAMVDSFGIETAQQLMGITPTVTEPDPDAEPDPLANIKDHPAYQELEKKFNDLATVLVGQTQEKEVQQEEARIVSEIASLAEPDKLGRELYPFEEEHLIMSMMNGQDLGQAFQSLMDYQQKIGVTPRPPAPTVLGANGGVPQTSVDPRKMSDSQRVSSAIEMLKLQNAQSRQG